MKAREDERNALYNMIFSLLPVVLVGPFFYMLVYSERTTAPLCLLAITSLLSSAYTMHYLPIDSARPAATRHPLLATSDGPIERYLPYLNAGIAVFLCLGALIVRSKQHSTNGHWLFFLLPALVLGIITITRRSMVDIQIGIGELDGMRYEYKGA